MSSERMTEIMRETDGHPRTLFYCRECGDSADRGVIMTTAAVARDLAGFLVPIGVVGAAIAVICAVIAGVAIMRGAGGLSGGAVGVWIPAALLSSTPAFTNQWMPLTIAGAALGASLVIGGVVRAIVAVPAGPRATARRAARATEAVEPAPATTTVVVPARPGRAVTGTIAVVR